MKFAVIYHDIYEKSPAFDLKDGVFYNGFRGFSIKVGKKEQDKSTLHDVLIYEQSNGLQDNTIISERGKMTMSDDKKFLEFRLQNGNRYEENSGSGTAQTEFINLGFQEYNKLFDLSQLNLQKTSDSLFMNNMRMKNMRQLNEDLDSLKKMPDSLYRKTKSDLTSYVQYTRYQDSTSSKEVMALATKRLESKKATSFDQLIPDSLKSLINDQTLNTVSNVKSMVEIASTDFKAKDDDVTQHRIEWHKKLSLSVACLVLFFIGAPLGSIIRKGGLGLPLVMALIFFMIFYLLNIFGEKFTKDHVLIPIVGMWLPVIVLSPVGFFLTYKAMHDSQLFNKEYYFRVFKNFRNFIKGKAKLSVKN